ncbi:predicted protein, partial [Nematostella vectensis]
MADEAINNVTKWLHDCGLSEFQSLFVDEGYDDLDVVATITDQELEEIGILKRGHRKKILLKIEELKLSMRQKAINNKLDAVKTKTPLVQSAGSCVTSDTKVIRDIFYNGNEKSEKATIILRIAPTFIRFGSFEIFKPIDPVTGRKGPSTGRKDILLQLLEYTIKTFYPKIYDLHSSPEERYLAFYKDLVVKTARLVAQWQCVGFCHGVLNTDNMSIVGLTIDYGPFGFMDAFDPQHICNDS